MLLRKHHSLYAVVFSFVSDLPGMKRMERGTASAMPLVYLTVPLWINLFYFLFFRKSGISIGVSRFI